MKLLTSLCTDAMSNKLFDYHPLCKKNGISTLLFADDLLLFTKPNHKLLVGFYMF